jgi:metal-dependent HD superfamily phosphatase/phosphodiesterase
MALRFEDIESIHLEGGVALHAFDIQTGARVPVRTTSEALQDFGRFEVEEMAREKYAASQIENGVVWVRTSDF